MPGSIISRFGMGLSIFPDPSVDDDIDVDVMVEVATAGTGMGVGRGGGALSLNRAALHCSRAPGMWSRWVANRTLYTLSSVTSRRPVYM